MDRRASGTAREKAAVLVPLVEREDELYVVYIRRSDAVESHRGQVAFPGGRVSPSDATLLETALRETHEEVGIEPAAIEVLGGFATMHTVSTGFAVAPFVGLVAGAAKLRPDPAEVAEIFEVPLAALSDPRYRGVYQWRRERGGPTATFPAILYRGHTIWGLTLRITESLLVIAAADGGEAPCPR
jgi:8-oxo-dGTP pyrophosphatase MutT (NUDIX family)